MTCRSCCLRTNHNLYGREIRLSEVGLWGAVWGLGYPVVHEKDMPPLIFLRKKLPASTNTRFDDLEILIRLRIVFYETKMYLCLFIYLPNDALHGLNK